MFNSILFFCLAGTAVISAGLLVTRRKPRHAVLCLVVTLLATAGIFLQLHASLLFLVELGLFAGGGAAFLVFAIRSTGIRKSGLPLAPRTGIRPSQKWAGLLVASAIGAEALFTLWLGRHNPGPLLLTPGGALPGAPAPGAKLILANLIGEQVLAFGMACALVPIAAVGFRVLSRRENPLR